MGEAVLNRRDAGNLVQVLIGAVLRLVLQLVPFIILARTLGADDFGSFAAVVALSAGFGGLVGWGSGNLFVRDFARNSKDLKRLTGRIITTTIASGAAVSAIVFAFALFVFDVGMSATTIAILVLADCFFGRVVHLQSFALLARGKGFAAAINDVVFAATRAVAAAVFLVSASSTGIDGWAYFYLAATVVGAGIALSWSWRDIIGAPLTAVSRADLVDGASFATGASAHMMRRQVDRPLAEVLLAGEASGQYAAAARLAEAAMMPIATFFRVAYRYFFEHALNKDRVKQLIGQFVAILAAGSIAIATSLWVVAGQLDLLLGPSYANSGSALQVLAVLPFLFAMNNLAGDVLSGMDRQWERVCCELLALGLKIALLIWLAEPGVGIVWFAGIVVLADSISTLILAWRSGSSRWMAKEFKHAE